MANYCVAIPNYISKFDHINEAKFQYLLSWKDYNQSTPLIILSHGEIRPDKKLDLPNSRHFYFDKALTVVETRYALCLIAKSLGFSHTLQVDDDFEVKAGQGSELDSLLDKSGQEPVWLNASRRMLFTSKKRVPVSLNCLNYVDDETKQIVAGTKLWEAKGDGFGYYFNTREGFSIEADKYLTALEETRHLMPKNVFDKHILNGEDCLCLAYNAFKTGLKLRRVTSIFHHQQREDDKNLVSTCRNPQLISNFPIHKYRETNDVDGLMDRVREVKSEINSLVTELT